MSLLTSPTLTLQLHTLTLQLHTLTSQLHTQRGRTSSSAVSARTRQLAPLNQPLHDLDGVVVNDENGAALQRPRVPLTLQEASVTATKTARKVVRLQGLLQDVRSQARCRQPS